MANSSGIRAGAAYVELFVKDNRLVRGLQAAQKKLAVFGAAVRSIGTKLLTLGAGLAAPLIASLKVFGSMGDSLAKMSSRTGIAVETLSELGYAADQSGANLEILEAGVRKMQRTISDAADGSQSAVDALSKLGLSAGQLKNLAPDEQFRLIADRLSKIENPTLRAAAALEIFGRSGTMLLPLMADGAAGIRELEKQARDLGLTISTDDAKAAEVFGDRLDDLFKVIKRAAFAIGSALAPLVTDLTIQITKVATTISEWIKQNKTLFVTILKIAAAAIGAGAALIVIGTVISGVGAAFGAVAGVIAGIGTAIGVVGSALAALLSPIVLVIAGLVGLAAYILTATKAGAAALGWLGGVFQDLRETALTAFQGIGDALAAGDVGLAAKILWLTLKLEWQKGINFLNKHWQEWKAFFLRVFNEAIFGIAGFFTDAWAGLQIAWVESVGFMADAWTIFTSTLTKGWRTAQNFISKGVLRLMALFDDSIDVDAASKILDEDMNRANQQLDDEVNRTVTEREQKRDQRRQEIESERQGSQSQLDAMRAEEEKKLQDSQQKGLDASQQALEAARKQWKDAIAEAARKRDQAKQDDRKAPDRLEKFRSQLGEMDDVLSGTEKRTVGVQGSFNAAAAQALGAGDASDRMAKGLDSIDKKLGKLLAETQHGGLVFA